MTALPEDLLRGFRAILLASTGLDVDKARSQEIERRLDALAADLGYADASACVRELLALPQARLPVPALARHFTIGETYFLREPGAFRALCTDLVPQLVRARALPSRRLRVWSAGCATGEEAYSIAIALSRIPELRGGDFTVIATDINPQALEHATRGIYREWSFRGVPEDLQRTSFRALPDGTFEILPALRRLVTFALDNLVDPEGSAVIRTAAPFDVIFCRNVLMYFSEPHMRVVVDRLLTLLAPDGFLVVSQTELSPELFGNLLTLRCGEAFVYRRRPPTSAEQALAPSPVTPARPPSERPAPGALVPDDAQVAARRARASAGEGRLHEAHEWSARAVGLEPLSASHRYLHATVLHELGDEAGAEHALRDALALDPDHVVAHCVLGNLLAAQGRTAAATRHLRMALRLLADRVADALVPDGDGVTTGSLAGSIAAAIRALQRSRAAATARSTTPPEHSP